MPGLDPPIPDLPAELVALLRQIPAGRVTTYGTLAEALGNRAAARWVGEFLLDHQHDERCGCHRVVRKDGDIGLSILGAASKAERLRGEGVVVVDGRVDVARYGFQDFESSRPLAALVAFQEQLPRQVRLRSVRRMPEQVGAFDVSYPFPDTGVAAYVLVESATGRLVWSRTLTRRVTFPYISGMLAYREMVLYRDLLAAVRDEGKLADVLLVDGHGMLHPRHAGIATHLGVLADVPTMGVGKKLLCGTVDLAAVTVARPQPVVHAEMPVGMAVKAQEGSRPVFVSPGQLIDIPSCVRIAQVLFHGHRVPEPIYHADALSRRVGKECAARSKM